MSFGFIEFERTELHFDPNHRNLYHKEIIRKCSNKVSYDRVFIEK